MVAVSLQPCNARDIEIQKLKTAIVDQNAKPPWHKTRTQQGLKVPSSGFSHAFRSKL